MTTFASEEVKCALCGKTSEFNVLMSTNTFGGTADLDLRPPEMQRSTMPLWVQECPHCGYVSEEISDETSVTNEFVSSKEYLECWGVAFKSDLAKRFYRYYKINLCDNNPKDAYIAVRNAVWACDDAGDTDNARLCRHTGIELLNKMIGEDCFDDVRDKETVIVAKADLMRRAGDYQEVVAEYADFRSDNELLEEIIRFQIDKFQEMDDNCYTISDVTKKE